MKREGRSLGLTAEEFQVIGARVGAGASHRTSQYVVTVTRSILVEAQSAAQARDIAEHRLGGDLAYGTTYDVSVALYPLRGEVQRKAAQS